MNSVFKKLNFKDQPALHIVNAPLSFRATLDEMRPFTVIHESLGEQGVTFTLAFATTQAEVDRFAAQVAVATVPDAVVWVAYPKGSSKNYRCEFNRDTGWTKLGELGFEPVRQVAIDEDWSALRFRRAEHIKTMTRSFAQTEAGREKVKRAEAKRSPQGTGPAADPPTDPALGAGVKIRTKIRPL